MWNALTEAAAPAPLRIAALEFLRGEYAAALEAARQSPPSGTRYLFETRVLYRMGRGAEALEAIATARKCSLLSTEADVDVALAFEAAISASLGRVVATRKALAHLKHPFGHAPEIEGEIAYYAALSTWILGDYERVLEILKAISPKASANVLARAETLRGWVYAVREHYGEQLSASARALGLLVEEQTPDLGLVANTLRTSAALTRDTASTQHLSEIERLERSLAWTQWMQLDRFQIVRTVAWAHAMRGDYIRAIRDLNRAKHLAPNPQSEMLSHLDHAWIAHISGEELHMRAELLEADACADRVNWREVEDEEVGALLLAAELYASCDADAANVYLQRAREVRKTLAPSLGFAHDRRLDAFTDTAEAHVRLARGDRAAAVRRARRAYDVFSEIGYAWRAANAALMLYRMGEGDAWLEPVRIVAAQYPRSFLAAELNRLRALGASPADRLTRRQREIANAIRRGLRTDAIARELDMAPNTVRVHKNKIFKAFGVSNEFELLGRLNAETA
jgi:DNA-binding CsgD family transcriptional regulator